MVLAIRALTASMAAVWISCIAIEVSAQVSGPTFADQRVRQQTPDYWYPYRGTVRWTLGPNGQPVMNPTDTPINVEADGPTTSRIGWQAPVVPVSPPGGYGYAGSPMPPTQRGPFPAESAGVAPQHVSRPGASCTSQPGVADASAENSADWWDSAWEATKTGFRAGGDAVVGGFNWIRDETRDAVGLVVGPDRIALRPKCPDCGRRHFPGRH